MTKLRNINGVSCPKPLKIKPSTHEKYYVENICSVKYFEEAIWEHTFFDEMNFERGIAYSSPDHAIKCCKARYER